VAANIIMQTDVERGLRLFRDWHIVNFIPRMNGVAPWAAKDPRHAAEFILQIPLDSISSSAIAIVGNEWAKQDPNAALEFAAANPGELGTVLGGSVMKERAASELPGERGLSAGAAAFNQWFGAQPAEATQWLRDLPPDDQRRSPFFEKAISSLAYELRASEVLAIMPPADRHAARSIIEKMALLENRRGLLLDALNPP
jgi:hypothetical protein